MVVRTQNNGRDNFGLRVGADNARRYFSRNAGSVDLNLDDLQIQCRLPETFWNGQPEIHDPRLCEWLKFKILRERQNRGPIALQMVPSGTNSFTLHPRLQMEKRNTQIGSAA